MPRGVKRTIDYQAKIEEIDAKIVSYKESIKSLTKERKQLIIKQENADMEAALEIISEKGVTASELLNLVRNVKK